MINMKIVLGFTRFWFLILILLPVYNFQTTNVGAETSDYQNPDFQKGFSFTGWGEAELRDPRAVESLHRLKSTGTEWVLLCVFWFQDNLTSIGIGPAYDYYSVNTTDTISYIDTIHDNGLKVVLKPFLDIKTGDFRTDIVPSAEWFEEYSTFVNFWAEIAEQKAVEMFVVGCELRDTESYTEEWISVINGVKALYSGPLVYSALFNSYQDIEFWGELDYIGVNAYYTLSHSLVPTLNGLKRGWEKYLPELEEFSKTKNKDILFTEIGFRSVDGCNIKPWNWQKKGILDENEQALCYEATFEVFNNISWMKGFYWWNWEAVYTEEDKKNYTPQEKLAEEVLKSWYKDSTPYPLNDKQILWIIIPTCTIVPLASIATILILKKKIRNSPKYTN